MARALELAQGLAASAKLCTTTAVEKSESAAHGLDQ